MSLKTIEKLLFAQRNSLLKNLLLNREIIFRETLKIPTTAKLKNPVKVANFSL